MLRMQHDSDTAKREQVSLSSTDGRAQPCHFNNTGFFLSGTQTCSGREMLGLFLPKYCVQSSAAMVEMELFYIPAWSDDSYEGNKRVRPDHKTG